MVWQVQIGGYLDHGEYVDDYHGVLQNAYLPTIRLPKRDDDPHQWHEDQADNGPMIRGVPRECLRVLNRPEPVPDSGILPPVLYWKEAERLYDAADLQEKWVVSPRLREMIEDLDPGIHDFYPVEMREIATGKVHPEPFFILHIRARLRSLDIEKSTVQTYPGGAWRKRKPGILVFHKSVIEGHHLWRDAGDSVCNYASDRFVEELLARDIRGIGAAFPSKAA